MHIEMPSEAERKDLKFPGLPNIVIRFDDRLSLEQGLFRIAYGAIETGYLRMMAQLNRSLSEGQFERSGVFHLYESECRILDEMVAEALKSGRLHIDYFCGMIRVKLNLRIQENNLVLFTAFWCDRILGINDLGELAQEGLREIESVLRDRYRSPLPFDALPIYD